MSYKALAWAFEQKSPSAHSCAVLFVLAGFADDNGVCWPSQKTIAEKTTQSDRSVRNQISLLIEAGLISKKSISGRETYQLDIHNQRKEVPLERKEVPPQKDTEAESLSCGAESLSKKAERGSYKQVRTSHKQVSKEKDKKESFSKKAVLPEWLDQDIWNEYLKHRKQMGKPMTPTAVSRALAKLDRLKASGHDPTAVITQTLENSWTGLFAVKDEKISGGRHHGPKRFDESGDAAWQNRAEGLRRTLAHYADTGCEHGDLPHRQLT